MKGHVSCEAQAERLDAEITRLRTQLEAASRDIALHKGLAGDFRKQADAALSQLGREREALEEIRRTCDTYPRVGLAEVIHGLAARALASPPTTGVPTRDESVGTLPGSDAK